MKAETRRSLGRIAPAALAIAVGLASHAPSFALDSDGYSVEVLVRGAPLTEYAARGTTYVEARRGSDYAVRLSNHTGERIAVALSVDGLNSIDAKTTSARDASKWVLDPHETVTIEGWQIGSATARRFFFTTEDRSYGAWLGKTEDLGVISAAVFREKAPAPIAWMHSGSLGAERPEDADGSRAPSSEAAAAPRAPRAGLPVRSAGPSRSEKRSDADQSALSPDFAATGIGREVEHPVARVRFECEENPVRVVRLRYEYRDALVRLGVLPEWHPRHDDPLHRRERAQGFEEPGFCPDPFRRDR